METSNPAPQRAFLLHRPSCAAIPAHGGQVRTRFAPAANLAPGSAGPPWIGSTAGTSDPRVLPTGRKAWSFS